MISYFRRRWFVEAEDFWEPFQCPTASLGPVVPTHLHTVGNTEASRERWRWIEMNWWTQIVFLSGLSLYSGLIVFFPASYMDDTVDSFYGILAPWPLFSKKSEWTFSRFGMALHAFGKSCSRSVEYLDVTEIQDNSRHGEAREARWRTP